MTDIPDNIDLNWIARPLVGMRRDLQSLRTDVDIMAAILRRVDDNQNAFREEARLLFEMHRDLRSRVDAVERGES
jgi:hypothetical protein